MIDLNNKTILVTGASSGIGRATAIQCSQAGARVIITGRNENELEQTRLLMRPDAVTITADLSSDKEISQLAETIGQLDGLVHCAGMINPLPVKFIKKKHIDELFNINLFSAMLLCGSLLSAKKLNAGASLVFISSVSSEHPYPGGALYTSAKASLEAYSRALALENAAKKIRSNIIAPALVKTKMLETTLEGSTHSEYDAIEKQYPLGFGEPSDVANAVIFLLSNASRWITGTKIVMDGGLLLNNMNK